MSIWDNIRFEHKRGIAYGWTGGCQLLGERRECSGGCPSAKTHRVLVDIENHVGHRTTDRQCASFSQMSGNTVTPAQERASRSLPFETPHGYGIASLVVSRDAVLWASRPERIWIDCAPIRQLTLQAAT